jgi:hypothetical protein
LSVNDRQVGGTHYRSALQHWDLIERNGIGYLEAAATKYVTRWRSKGGVQDLEKAVHYVEKLIELFEEGVRTARGTVDHVMLATYAEANKLNDAERNIITILCRWSLREDLFMAQQGILMLVRKAMGGEETSSSGVQAQA